ncbi:MAG: GNAT family protein [Acidobacteriota bacterium]|nr:GNAT family N-acetyltransferase [Blastocatellia bacterium]MDW8240527.1 GNAT family protein [Acidobacteriota bacterium]
MLKLRSDVTVVPVSLEHAPNMFRWMCDPVIRKNLGLRSEPSLERTETWIKNALQDPTVHPLAALLNDQHVGNVVLDRIDAYLASARLSVYIGEPSARGAGVGLTAIYRALVEGFESLCLHKVWLTVHCQNYAAINAYVKLGFTLEGILRDEFWLDGRRVNAWYMGLLHDDFKRLVVEVEKGNG